MSSPVTQQTVTLAISKPLSGGRHFAEVQLREKGRAIDWATQTFEVRAQTTIRDLVLESDRVQLGGQVNARLRLQSNQAVGQAADSTITARLYDNYDRLLDERRYPIKVQGAQSEVEQQISLNSTGALTHLARVDCEVSINGVRSDRRLCLNLRST